MIVVDPLVAQFSVLLAPELMLLGFAVNELIEGADPAPGSVPESAGFPAFPQPTRAAHAKKKRTAAPEWRTEVFLSGERAPMRTRIPTYWQMYW